MTEDTPGTRSDPELAAEGDGNQLSTEDTLLDRGTQDALDEGYSPPERPRRNHWGETSWEETHGEPLDQRLAEEEPDVWERDPLDRPDTARAGRLVEDDDADPNADGARDNDVYGTDAGIDGAGATAEEAAVHWVEEP
ncbi:hypothetical protein BCE75_10584 [Isoptericola sp. CG 20/1183]|uniref:DUF5709 domain-containing protein n=1 Tax=Isoptericola halotolerans TaxID=300560 RepID=A0ABX5EFE7_9MICO|nr:MULTISPECIES: DUF5709 domain-containing protein [Isoptericola]MCK0117957.1 DUF5709 domain-containing protein [Isoptericola sp. S6320L]PRZ07038.1 hypothetical protein BCL65_105179 [Isoptericola halotolerans]PRZ07290.1 hypothetical protein BCE75_10584 [Isoptericola sp. CG 20/1183]